MMRILAAHVYHESNTFCPEETRLEHFESIIVPIFCPRNWF